MSTVPFRRHEGTRSGDLDDSYLPWLTELDLREPLRSDVLAEHDRRERTKARPASALVAASPGRRFAGHFALQFIHKGGKAVAARGSLEVAQDVREAARLLRVGAQEVW